MKLKLSQLKKIIREAILETMGNATTVPNTPVINNFMGLEFADREQLTKNSLKDKDDEDLDSTLSHFSEPMYDKEDCWGPVPPSEDNNPYMLLDPYTKNI